MAISPLNGKEVGFGSKAVFQTARNPKEDTNQQLEAEDSDAVTLVNEQPTSISVNAFLDVAADAANAIVELAYEQKQLVDEAQSETNPERLVQLNTEHAALETEIQNIKSEAEFNDNKVFSENRTFSVQGSEANTSNPVSVVENFSATTGIAIPTLLLANPGVDISTELGAEAAEETTNDRLSGLLQFRNDVEARRDQSEAIVNRASINPIEESEKRKEEVKSERKAAQLAQSVTDQLARLANNATQGSVNAQSALVDLVHGNLDPSRVRRLLG